MQKTAPLRLLVIPLVLVIALVGCTPVPTDAESDDADETVVEPDVVGVEPPAAETAADFTYLGGTWTITAELTEIDKGTMRDAAERPTQRWDCTVDGSTMTLVTDTHTYSGTISSELDEAWVFTATAELVDEDGYAWTSAIEIHGRPTGDGLMAGTMEESVDSAERGHEYTAGWRIEGRRQ